MNLIINMISQLNFEIVIVCTTSPKIKINKFKKFQFSKDNILFINEDINPKGLVARVFH